MKNQKKQNEKYVSMLFSMLRKRDGLAFANGTDELNGTEMRLLGEIVAAGYEGRRMISTQLAKALGITRSAVSQMVNRLEKEHIVRRVADDVDRKIFYVEITEEALKKYGKDLENFKHFVANVVAKFGEEAFLKLCNTYNEFLEIARKEKELLGLGK